MSFFESIVPSELMQSRGGQYLASSIPSVKSDAWRFTDASALDFSRLVPLSPSYSPLFSSHRASVSSAPIDWIPTDKFEWGIKSFANSTLKFSVSPHATASLRLTHSPTGSVCAVTEVDVGEGATLDFYEDLANAGAPVFFGHKLVFNVRRGSRLNYYSLQRFPNSAVSMVSRDFHLGESSVANIVAAEFGSSFSRSTSNLHFDGAGSRCDTHKILFLASGSQQFDFTTNAFHNAPNTESDICVKGALFGSSRRVYRGLINIAKAAPKTSSFLRDDVLHLSKGVSSNSIPSLVIDNNDVAASHAATVTRLDDESLFYLRSRGISRNDAAQLVVNGLVNDVASSIPDEPFSKSIEAIASRTVV